MVLTTLCGLRTKLQLPQDSLYLVGGLCTQKLLALPIGILGCVSRMERVPQLTYVGQPFILRRRQANKVGLNRGDVAEAKISGL